jgi:PAS domain S-box-containing protein
LSRSTVALAVLVALLEAAGAVAIVATSDHESHKVVTSVLAVTAGLSFIATGLIALRRRPQNRTGWYLAGVGYLFFFAALGEATSDTVWTVGVFFSNLVFVPFAALVLAFPTGRLARRPDQLLVTITAAFVLIGPPLLLLFASHPPSCGDNCPDSVIVVYRSQTVEHIVDLAGTAVTIAIIAAVVAVLLRRWRRASAALRKVLLPVYLTGAAALVTLLLSNLLSSISAGAGDALSPVFFLLFAAVPIAFLAGLLRSRLARGSAAGLLVAVGRGMPLRDAIADALGDPSLDLAYSVDDGRRFVDREGRRVALPRPGSGRTATMVKHDGRRVAAIVHDDSLRDEPELVESVTATVELALDNERLEAELRAQYDYLSTIFDTAPSLLVTVDLEGRIRNLNSATVEASGLSGEAEVHGRFFWDVFIDPSEREAMIARFNAAAPRFPQSEYENVFTNARGERRVIYWRSAPVVDDTGNVVRIVAGGLDITDRKDQEEELRASRTRLVAAGDEERRRLERNLHDGAQQRLVSLSVALRLARSRLESDANGAGVLLDQAADELSLALEELRELARGIHPAVLTDRGLGAALQSLADRTPIPVALHTTDRPLPEPVAAAAYYVVSEAIANVVKHARATSIEVQLSAPDGFVVVEVADDGVGGADPSAGSGLRGLADRVAVLDGSLRVESSASGGTRVVAEIPLGKA